MENFEIIENCGKTADKLLNETVIALKHEVDALSEVSKRFKIIDCLQICCNKEGGSGVFLWTGIENLGFSVRTFNCLARYGIKSVKGILENWDELPNIRNLGIGCAVEIIDKMYELGFKVPNGSILKEHERNGENNG
ncbi:MAG: hypothetical protein NC299_17265 [Lachnospiraceae bacterium]|nr:hypothetical protein [Lachnospiraceae bacterium]